MVDFANWSGWSIRPEYLEEVLNNPVFIERMKSVTGSVDDLQAIIQRDGGEEKPYKIIDGVAVIPIIGPLAKRMSFLMWIMGGMTFDRISELIYKATWDLEVDAIVLDIDSPGGTVSGTDAFAEVISAAAAIKPVVAFANGCMCSAAYWIASSASMIIAERTASVGSIGVIMVHADFSKMDEKDGVKFTVIKAGKYKAVGNPYEPLSEEDQKIIQAELDALYDIFLEVVACNRRKKKSQVQSEMAEGRIFIGAAAVEVGLIDSIGNLQDAIDNANDLAEMVEDGVIDLPITGAMPPNKEQLSMGKEKQKMIVAPETVKELVAALPELAQALKDEGAKSVDMNTEVGAEGDRILGLAMVHFGSDAGGQFGKIVKSGITEEQYKAVCGENTPGAPQNELKGKDEVLDALKGSGPANPGPDNGSENLQAGSKDFMGLVEEHMAVFKCSKVEALREVMKKNPKAHQEYLKSVN